MLMKGFSLLDHQVLKSSVGDASVQLKKLSGKILTAWVKAVWPELKLPEFTWLMNFPTQSES